MSAGPGHLEIFWHPFLCISVYTEPNCKVTVWAEPQVSAQEVFIFKAAHPVSAQRAIQP